MIQEYPCWLATSALTMAIPRPYGVVTLKEPLRLLLVPVMRAWVRSTSESLLALPHPTDTPTAHSPGWGDRRILILGTGPAVGWGVLSHDLALPGALARSLTARNGRAVDADVIAAPMLTVDEASSLIQGLNLSGYDSIVVIIGVTDARRLISSGSWRRGIRSLAEFLIQKSSPAARIFLVGIPPIQSIPNYHNLPGKIAGRHAEALNRVTEQESESLSRTRFIPLPATSPTPPNRHRDPAAYRHWAEVIAESMIEPGRSP